jgi:hypothetical protein
MEKKRRRAVKSSTVLREEKEVKEKRGKREKKSQRTLHSASDRCRAVLSVWTERRKPSEVCRELGVNWAVLHHWEKRALEGMLGALEPRRRQERGPELSARLRRLIMKKEVKKEVLQSRLERRLETIQASQCGKEESASPKSTEKGK